MSTLVGTRENPARFLNSCRGWPMRSAETSTVSHLSTNVHTTRLLAALALTATSCGLEGTRLPICDQEGAICEILDTDPGDTDVSPSAGRTDLDDDDSGDTGGTAGESGAGTDGSGDATSSDDDTASSDDGVDSSSDDATTGGLTEPPPGFPTPEPFGDSVLETDLVGKWTLPTDSSPVGYAMALEITAEGRFGWREYDDACGLTQSGSGWIWVEGAQMVMLFGDWTGPAPWPVGAKYGWDAEVPFMVRAGYAPVLGHIGLTLPPAVREALPWRGRGYTRTVGGTTVRDVWIAETELWDIAPGSDVADIVVRDRTTIDAMEPPSATETFNRWWFQQGEIDPEVPVTTQLQVTDDGLGNAAFDGASHVYLSNKMGTFSVGDNFVLGGGILCE